MSALGEKNTGEAGHGSQKRGTQQAPRPATGPNTVPTVPLKMEPHDPGTNSRGAGNPRSGPSGRSTAGPIQLLSEWCQKHGFNPTWQLKPLPGDPGLATGNPEVEQRAPADAERSVYRTPRHPSLAPLSGYNHDRRRCQSPDSTPRA
ncbi:hypothetical protein NEMBOFW57_003548 [Staphylotrichum longicolle]|uniref:Uncharacterized protein n=1 Tax=Staphylotrichum longicolle TaxID=669026 RepID=A0AAD4F5N9_9PEZI|nr:hypothetical protein NEMBOFW57_003548 [Staphylotrichum longicolle]